MSRSPLRVLMSAPAYWPAVEFGGPVWTTRELAEGLVARGHAVDVLTTSLTSLARPPAARLRTHRRDVGGVAVHYLATPFRYRWMGVTPSAPLVLRGLEPPDVAHVGGFRDPLGTAVALWCRAARVPYVFEPLGMFRAKWRKVLLKRLLDATLLRPVARGAAAIVAVSERERDELVAAGAPRARVVVRGNGFPAPAAARGSRLRPSLGLGPDARVVLFGGRLATGKGIPLLLGAARELADVHVALVGPDGGDGTREAIDAAARAPGLRGRVHVLPPPPSGARPLALYADADALVLPSAEESFGMVAAEAAAAGVPAVVTEGCGIAPLVRDRAALVVPYRTDALRDALARLLSDDELRRRLSAGGPAVAREHSWEAVVARQEAIYREVLR